MVRILVIDEVFGEVINWLLFLVASPLVASHYWPKTPKTPDRQVFPRLA